MVDDQYRPNLIQALTRSPFHPISPSIEKSVIKAANSMPSSNRSTPNKNISNTTSNTIVQQGILKVSFFLYFYIKYFNRVRILNLTFYILVFLR